ncbi:protein dpy-30 homolog [Lutra lutra]|uniref:protein dpy-30 homolog n=1 Tax=Lutra lutra TaxID=9657 RepID=UPI001FD1FA53|nr:protein dpy-30 homolog [Lutra lutra]
MNDPEDTEELEQMLKGEIQVPENPYFKDCLIDNVDKIVGKEKTHTERSSKQKAALWSLPTCTYLDQTVMPILLTGTSVLAKGRPPNPTEFLAFYLFKNKAQFEDRN